MVGIPKATLTSFATAGLAIKIEVPESTIAESNDDTYFPPILIPVNFKTHQASKATG